MKKANKKEAQEEKKPEMDAENLKEKEQQEFENETQGSSNNEDLSENSTETKCQDEKTDLLYRLAEMNDKFLRLHSEFDNYRKRTIKEKNDLSKFANSELITELLPVIDDFERALKSMQKNTETEPLILGVELIYSKLTKILFQQGLKPIKSIGEEFNTDFHEAITKVPATDENMKGKVFDEVQKGYELNEKIIRYAKVVVAE